jgi:hypothetical protein
MEVRDVAGCGRTTKRKLIEMRLQMPRRTKILEMKWNKVNEAQAFKMEMWHMLRGRKAFVCLGSTRASGPQSDAASDKSPVAAPPTTTRTLAPRSVRPKSGGLYYAPHAILVCALLQGLGVLFPEH